MAQAKHNKKKKFRFAQINPLKRKKAGQDEEIRSYYDDPNLSLTDTVNEDSEEHQDIVEVPGTEHDSSAADVTGVLPATSELSSQDTAILPISSETSLLSADDAWSPIGGDLIKDFGDLGAEPPRSRRRTLLWIILGVVLGVLLLAYLGASFYFTTHFGFNTVIDNIDCSFMTVDQVESQIAEQVGDYSLTIVERNGANETIKGSTVDLTYISDGQVQALLAEQHPLAWISRLFMSRAVEKTTSSVTLNATKLTTQINALKCMNKANMIAPQDAYAEYNGSMYVPHAEVLGTTINTDVMYDAVKAAMLGLDDSINLDSAGCYVQPAVVSTSPSLIDSIASYNKYANFCITYKFGTSTEILDARTAFQWLTIGSGGSVTVDKAAVKAWVAAFAARHDTVGATRTFTAADGATATVSGGTYGWLIDQNAEVKAILALLDGTETDRNQTRDPYYAQDAASHGATDWGTSYIDLDLTDQHMWLIMDGAVVFQADVVTGLPTTARQTPSGVYDILEMVRNKTLRGQQYEDGSYEYETPVAYWMRVTWTGVGFHDATWQPWFGGTRYKTNGSHGCINMSYSDAQKLYSLVQVGLPVVIHY